MLLLAIVLAATNVFARETALTGILEGLDRVSRLTMMDEAKIYELPARGVVRSGGVNDFLRGRAPDEILASGLSTGCGDYAAAFYRLMAVKGLDVQYIDSAALTLDSLARHFSGHTAVAVKDTASGNWILVDATFGKIISGDWNPESRLYVGPAGRFWIGYRGSLEDFPVKDAAALRKFYGDTLKSVPADVGDKEFSRFEFTIDDSMKRKDGGYTNPRVLDFIHRADGIYKANGIAPSRAVKVTLKDGGNAAGDDCRKNADGSWDLYVARNSAMSLSLTDWLARRVLR